MTAINHFVSPQVFHNIAQRSDTQELLWRMREHFYAKSIVWTQDMLVDSYSLTLNSKKWRDQAKSMMDLNIIPIVSSPVTKNNIYVPYSVFSQISQGFKSINDILSENPTSPDCVISGPTTIYPMIWDKAVCMTKSTCQDPGEIDELNEKVREYFDRIAPDNDRIYEGIALDERLETHCIESNPHVEVEWMNKPYRTDENWAFQKHIRSRVTQVSKILGMRNDIIDVLLKDDFQIGSTSEISHDLLSDGWPIPVNFDFLPKDRFHYA